MKPIDIFITTYERQDFAKECVDYLVKRTHTPYRLTVIDNGGNEWAENDSRVHRYIPLWKVFGNTGIHFAWNVAVSLADGDYFITSDPDLLVPDVSHIKSFNVTESGLKIEESVDHQPDWLERMVVAMDELSDFGAISMMPHIFVGAVGIDPNDSESVKERNMCGAVFRIMRTEAVQSVRGWDLKIEAGRNHEERTICSRLRDGGWKVGVCSRIRAYHNFGKNWGYPDEFTPEMQKHNPALKEEIMRYDNRDAYDPKTWFPK